MSEAGLASHTPATANAGRGELADGPFEMIIAGGNVLDPEAGISGYLDIAIRAGRVSEIAKGLGERFPDVVLDVSGSLVLPGLVDIHTHCYWGGTYFGIRPDPIAGGTGVTTWVDAGSAGAWNLGAFRQLADASRVNIRSFINVSGVGLVARTGELDHLEYCNEADLMAVVAENRDFIVGIKVRMGHAKHGIVPLERAIAAAEKMDLPVMVHIRNGPPDVREILALLRPGDLLTHCFTGADMALVADGNWIPEAQDARSRGVLFDLAHGGASFGWASAEAGFAAGFLPDMISSDLHQLNYFAPNVDLPQSMSKMLHLGMGLPDIVRAVTSNPAAAICMAGEVGTLRPGSVADIAIFDIESGDFPMADTHKETRITHRRFKHVLTIADGDALPNHQADRPAPYLSIADPSIAGAQSQIDQQRAGIGVHSCC